MTGAFRRILLALAGGAIASALVAVVEAGAARAGAGPRGVAFGTLVVADLGVLVPLAIGVAGVVALAALFLEPERSRTIGERLASRRSRPILLRTRDAALAPLVVLAGLAWCLVMAHVARALLAAGAPMTTGIKLGAAGLFVTGVLAALVLTLLRPVRRALASGAAAAPALVDPAVTTSTAVALAAIAVAWGVYSGDTGGDGGALGIFGVLKRGELDLRPLVNLLAIALGAYLTQVAFGARRGAGAATGAALVVFASCLFTLRDARALNQEPTAARAIARGAPLGKMALAALRRATDRDRDGASPWFGGGDCDDRDPRRSPLAIELPDDGIDQDCSGSDLHQERPAPRPAKAAELAASPVVFPRLPPDLNVLVITVDTLRADVGFMGYPKGTTPNLDALAEKGIVFDRMYALASYTGKSIGPLFIGKYPSETRRDGGHFNTYLPANAFLAERLKAEGVHTFGAAPHWYFEPWSGLSQGFETWNLQAMPAGGQGDNDTSVTSKDLSDQALRLLRRPEHTSRRFFAWLHYFDPHEQYMPHEDAPSFGPGTKGAYDAEVWFTDKHIGRVLDYVASQPWGARTAIVVTADHGEAFGEHGMRWHGYELWESLVRVPFLVYVPGVAPHHVPVKRSHIDLVPTVLDLMGVPHPPEGELSGESMIEDILAPSAGGVPHVFEERDVYLDMPPGPYTAMRHALVHGTTPGEKLIQTDTGQFQLFDLAADPDEKDDLADDAARAADLAEMKGRLEAKRATLREIEVKVMMPTAP